VLIDDLEWSRAFRERNDENILSFIDKGKDILIFYDGHIQYLRDILRLQGYDLKIKHVMTYWRSPLEALNCLIVSRGIENISNQVIKNSIKEHIKYVDSILAYPTLDLAHKTWEESMKPL